jgi:hypothetical protein
MTTEHTLPQDEVTDEVTPGGFHKIELDVDDDQLSDLVKNWASSHLDPASYEQFTEILTESGNITEALYSGVVNSVIIESINCHIENQSDWS